MKAWAKGKEKNIRALISSLHLILWEGETRWNEVGMHQLVQPEEVTYIYIVTVVAKCNYKFFGRSLNSFEYLSFQLIYY